MTDSLQLSGRPLIVSDIDEVVLEFLTPFEAFLRSRNLTLLPRSFRLHGNIQSLDDGSIVGETEVDDLLEGFFASQDQWQTLVTGAAEALAALSQDADIVFLTAMPPRHRDLRRGLLDRFGLHFPLIASEEPKGQVLQELRGDHTGPLVFIDDIARNLNSVGTCIPDCLLIHLMANAQFRAMAPQTGDHIVKADDWHHARNLIMSHFASVSPA